MDHVITIGGLLLFISGFVGVLLLSFGFVAFFAGAMSDAPDAAASAGRWGCILGIVGMVLFVGSILGAIL